MPPGWADAGKGKNGYGDLIIWKEILKLAQAEKRPVILISNDQKPDWVLKKLELQLGPQPALSREFYETMDSLDYWFYICTLTRFLELAKQAAGTEIPEGLGAAARAVQESCDEKNDDDFATACKAGCRDTSSEEEESLCSKTGDAMKASGVGDSPKSSGEDAAVTGSQDQHHGPIPDLDNDKSVPANPSAEPENKQGEHAAVDAVSEETAEQAKV